MKHTFLEQVNDFGGLHSGGSIIKQGSWVRFIDSTLTMGCVEYIYDDGKQTYLVTDVGIVSVDDVLEVRN